MSWEPLVGQHLERRRRFLLQSSSGLGAAALASLLPGSASAKSADAPGAVKTRATEPNDSGAT